ncbi:peptidase S8 and S53 subtilisin kexin sedolisin [Kribbella flavida DSM 17836]|uniref:Peptidase S8 and S53 subtilisin kexin sedolisin n=1 Tax=Kribbella flavida (strain DSM 17836 / JCM 10339 / NBRC 14399) TaxID=479435 RepID=D2PQL0_KRIFD|nr:S8 family serine peptidase [Kribbella flavida]ADB29197.1 peptidase S8 and S53 subtilisin kexin sedolisin [Kribbella flavida DSM 17836]
MSTPVQKAALFAAGLALAATSSLTATAAPPGPAAQAASPVAAGKAQKVTLITGDVVEIADAGAGKKSATVLPAPGRERVAFHTVEVDGGLRVLPSDAVPYISSGLVDSDLFDVEELLADGYGDAATGTLPLIVRYADGARIQSLAGTTNNRPLASIGGAAVSATKAELPGLWESLKPAAPTARSLDQGVSKVWLDGKVKPVLDRSVAQIGAPAAWQAGLEGSGIEVAVLDTGVDAHHPDLAGKVQKAEDFSGSPTGAEDHFGHGTHVAATIAGTGAGAGGTRKGVAPKADLLVGKVLGDDGSGYESWIIAGMEWAAAEGAKVVNMSLGGGATDGTDPLSQAVNDITADSGTLFVVAAGNEGQDQSVGTPGAAAAALTVGAVDRNDALADFSSRGPRVGDSGLKPEITAPGVDIVAARATGTAMGTPLDNLYTAASGTSMATPHVAGAAVLLAQAHPDWTADRIKNALTSTAKTTPDLSVYAQGTGRVDLARAVAQKVYATGVADFGLTGVGSSPTTRPITYRNDTPAPVTLNLAVDVDNLDSHQPETDAFGVPATVTVPAGGSVDVPLALDPAKLERGLFSGWLVATGPNGVSVRTAVGSLKAGPTHQVRLRAVGLDGQPTGVPVISLYGDNPRSDTLAWLDDGQTLTAQVEEGTYLLHSLVENNDPQDEKVSLFTDPNIVVDRDREIVIDARKAAPITIHTPKPSEQRAVLSYYVHREYPNGRKVSHGVMHFSTVSQVLVTPTRPVKGGSFEFASRWQLVAPLVQASVQGVSGPLDINLLHRSPSYEGRKRFSLVAAGPDLRGVKGAIAVLESSEDGWGNGSEQDQIAEAAKAGAAGVILVRPADWSAWTVWVPTGEREPIPAMVTTQRDGARLVNRAKAGRATIDLTLTTSSPYLYDVFQVSAGHIPAKIDHRVTTANSARISTSYADNGGFGWAKEQRFGWRPWQDYSWNDSQRFVQTPKVREEWVSAGDSLWKHRVHHLYTWDTLNPLAGGMTSLPRSYRTGTSSETWFEPVVRPAAAPGLVSTRTGDRFSLRVPSFVDAAGHYTLGETTSSSAVLKRNGAVVADLPDAWQDVLTSGGDAAYRLEVATERVDEAGEWNWGTRTQTAWDFRSKTAAGEQAVALPLLQVGYDVPADLTGRVAGRAHVIGFKVQQQAGAPAPRSTALQAEVSFDEGKSWRRIAAVGAFGKYIAVVPAGKGTVSLRVSAADNAGNKVTQTVIRAYGLR